MEADSQASKTVLTLPLASSYTGLKIGVPKETATLLQSITMELVYTVNWLLIGPCIAWCGRGLANFLVLTACFAVAFLSTFLGQDSILPPQCTNTALKAPFFIWIYRH